MTQLLNKETSHNADALPLWGAGGLDILICTINEGIQRVPSVLMPPQEGVRYVVCMQYTDEEALDKVPMKLMMRKDVKFYVHEGKGLSKNRNFAFDWAEADIVVIADDDNRYKPEYIERIRKAYEENPDADIICFAAESYEGKPMKRYPKEKMSYAEAFKQGYYPTSMEMTMRRRVGVKFNENFGLGSKHLCAGEEAVFMKDAIDKGYKALFVPEVIVDTRYETTGGNFLSDKKMQISKGATFRYLFGKQSAIIRSIKESLSYFVKKGCNPIPIFGNMLRGINLTFSDHLD